METGVRTRAALPARIPLPVLTNATGTRGFARTVAISGTTTSTVTRIVATDVETETARRPPTIAARNARTVTMASAA
ncbi:hypothetical protein DPMN_038705 [Dreissena polymorpha]|uniref:Uncharacterized protein n=1 Tax=Dreissena polymorpha TaxID=45954 RepID=A0A9D4MGU9_DREPO|nr:hypothetical protein DPMN_038705 [Dreissena polymorpha]